jgi:hypothetical protein
MASLNLSDKSRTILSFLATRMCDKERFFTHARGEHFKHKEKI